MVIESFVGNLRIRLMLGFVLGSKVKIFEASEIKYAK